MAGNEPDKRSNVLLLFLAAAALSLAAGAAGQIPQFKLENPDTGYPTKYLGQSVSVDGDTMIAGASYNDGASAPGLIAGAARVYRRDGLGGWTLEGDLIASDMEADDSFGGSVSISGDTAIVGAIWSNTPSGRDTGSAYVFTRSGGVWTQQAKLTASDAEENDNFGRSVSISGDTVVVGAYNDDTTSGMDTGSAYVFISEGGVWAQQAKLTASDAAASDHFGFSVSVSGDTAVVGAHHKDEVGIRSGSAYVFTRSAGVWAQQQKLVVGDAAARDYFGVSVSVSGDTAVIGADGDDDGGTDSGSAYVFTRSGGVWSLQAKLTNPDPWGGDSFGRSVSVSGDTAGVAAPGNFSGGVTFGAAYVFTRSAGVWSQGAKLTASDTPSTDFFGGSVSVSGDTAVVGASGDDDGSDDSGAIYVFSRSGSTWTQEDKIIGPLDTAAGDRFGNSVSVSGDTAVIGTPEDDGWGLDIDSGSVYVFTYAGGVWSQQAKLITTDVSPWTDFGASVSISGDTAIVGAQRDSVPGRGDTGLAYVFTRSAGVWTQQQQLVAADVATEDRFGCSVSISGDTAVVGAHGDDDGGDASGSAYVFIRSGGVWTQQQKLTSADAAADHSFGYSVSVSGDTAVVGESGSGSAYVFTRSGGVWTLQANLTASDAEASDYSVHSVSVSGDTAVVGAYHKDEIGNISYEANVFTRSGGVWAKQQKLVAGDAEERDRFGASVSVSGDTVVVGAFGDDDAGGASGSAYVFTRAGGVWTERTKLTAADAAGEDHFGNSVAVDGGHVLVGAYLKDDPERNSGAAYAFEIAHTMILETNARVWFVYE